MLGRRNTQSRCLSIARVGLVGLVLLVGAPAAVGQVPRATQLTASASATATPGEFYDTATLAGGFSPTGTITFALYGPNDDSCSRAPAFTSVKPVNGVGAQPVTVTSDRALVAAPGVYHFVATYSGDAAHAPAGPTACADPAQAIGFGSSSVSFSAQASPATTVGGSLWDTATVHSSAGPTGTVSFSLYGPDAPDCAGTPVFTSATPVNGGGSYRSASHVATTPGTYRWVASYEGMSTACADPAQQVRVAPAPANLLAGPCAVIAQHSRSFLGALVPYLGPRLSAWSARLGCGG